MTKGGETRRRMVETMVTLLRRQGLMQGLWCLDPNEGMSPGQKDEIDRVTREHSDLSDDAFVAANLNKWLA